MTIQNPKDIVAAIKELVKPGTPIPKPESDTSVVKGWGKRRGEPALIYTMKGGHEKGITESEWRCAFEQLQRKGELTKPWFKDALAKCWKEGDCNFTTIGGVLVLLGVATYNGNGCYKRKRRTT